MNARRQAEQRAAEATARVKAKREAEEARCDERHAKRVIKAITVDVKRNPDVWPDPGGHEAALAAAPVWRTVQGAGRVSWMENGRNGMDDAAWHLFDARAPGGPGFEAHMPRGAS